MLNAMRALEYQIRLKDPQASPVYLRLYSDGEVHICIPSDVAVRGYDRIELTDSPPYDELLRVHHSIRLWFDEHEFDFDDALQKSAAATGG